MALPKALLTVADVLAMPDRGRGERDELFDGVYVVNPAPVLRHQLISDNLIFALQTYVRAKRLGVVVTAPGVTLDDRNYVIPDGVFIAGAQAHQLETANLEVAPDLVLEVLSPGTRRNDLLVKRNLYARFGVREYWVVDPVALSVTVLALAGEGYAEVAPMETGVVTSRVLPGLRLTLDAVFEDVGLAPGDDVDGEES
ncbi:MAG: Uma2 family endonuclease [Thermomicrobiales bacterium]